MPLGLDLSDQRTRDAARLAIQSAVSAATFYSIMSFWGLPEKFVGTLSAVLVVQPSVGNTLVKAQRRLVATVIGCIIGGLCLIVIPGGYGTAVALAVSMLVMNFAAGFRPEWRYGVVAAVALALRSETDVFETAFNRTIAIGLGVIVGAAVSWILWPEKSSRRAHRHLHAALEAISGYFDLTMRDTQGESNDGASEARNRYLRELSAAREAISAVRIADNEPLQEKADCVERLQNSVVILDRVAEKTDHVAEEHPAISEKQLERIRAAGCEIAADLARGKASSDDMDEFREQLGQLRESLEKESAEKNSRTTPTALYFALDEIGDSLDCLFDLNATSE